LSHAVHQYIGGNHKLRLPLGAEHSCYTTDATLYNYYCSLTCAHDISRDTSSGGSRLGPGGTAAPPDLSQAPQIFRVITVHKLLLLNTGQLDTVVLLVVVSQMMRGQPPHIFFS